MTEQTDARSWPWRTIVRQCGNWALVLLAVQGIVYYMGITPVTLPILIATFALGCLVTALMLRRNPHYYDRRSPVPDA